MTLLGPLSMRSDDSDGDRRLRRPGDVLKPEYPLGCTSPPRTNGESDPPRLFVELGDAVKASPRSTRLSTNASATSTWTGQVRP